MESNTFKHMTDIQQRFNDFDFLGHVNNAVYQHYFDTARLSYFRDVVGLDITGNEYSLVMANICIDYFNPIYKQENTAVRTRIEQLGNKSITMLQEILNPDTGQVKSSSRATLVTFCLKDNKSCEVPGTWKEKIMAFESEVRMKTN